MSSVPTNDIDTEALAARGWTRDQITAVVEFWKSVQARHPDACDFRVARHDDPEELERLHAVVESFAGFFRSDDQPRNRGSVSTFLTVATADRVPWSRDIGNGFFLVVLEGSPKGMTTISVSYELGADPYRDPWHELSGRGWTKAQHAAVTKKIEEVEADSDNYENADNFRLARCGNAEEEAIYHGIAANGCCGSEDWTIDVTEEDGTKSQVRFGCNFGH